MDWEPWKKSWVPCKWVGGRLEGGLSLIEAGCPVTYRRQWATQERERERETTWLKAFEKITVLRKKSRTDEQWETLQWFFSSSPPSAWPPPSSAPPPPSSPSPPSSPLLLPQRGLLFGSRGGKEVSMKMARLYLSLHLTWLDQEKNSNISKMSERRFRDVCLSEQRMYEIHTFY